MMDSSVHKQLHFKSVNAENRREVEGLTVFSEQTGFIESVSECLREADELELWRPVGIYDSDTLIGFAMYGYFPEPAPGQLWLDRLLIDKRYQDMENRRCFRFLTDCIQSIRAARYILACMRIIPMQSSFINRLVSGLTGNTIARGNISWSIIFERCRASQRSICAESS